ncbi:MAG: cation transporter [Victivallales bacterium]|nr:cation transporter [Victivallales bacterium]
MKKTENTAENSKERSIRNITLWGMALNLALTAAKFAVGFAIKSQSCIADAVHSFSDFLTDIAVLVGVRFWTAPADKDHPHGHQRIEALITLFISVLLCLSALGMASKAIKTIGDNNAPPASWPLLGIALFSIFIKEVLYQCTVIVGHSCGSSALIANAWHHRSDAISSIPVAVVAIAGRIWPGLNYLDQIAAVLVACLLLRTAWKIAWPCIKELSDQGASPLELKEIKRIASAVPGVMDVHKVRTRWFGSGILLDMHILVDKDLSVEEGHRICEKAALEIKRKRPIVLDALTHLEPYKPIDLKGEILRIAKEVKGAENIQIRQIQYLPDGNQVECRLVVPKEMPIGEAQKICDELKTRLHASNLKITRALVYPASI